MNECVVVIATTTTTNGPRESVSNTGAGWMTIVDGSLLLLLLLLPCSVQHNHNPTATRWPSVIRWLSFSVFPRCTDLFEQLQKHRQLISWQGIMSPLGSKLSVSKCVCVLCFYNRLWFLTGYHCLALKHSSFQYLQERYLLTSEGFRNVWPQTSCSFINISLALSLI